MLGDDPPEHYDDGKLTRRQFRKLERHLKREIANNMAWAQHSRAKGDRPNGYARRGVIDNARILRSLMRAYEHGEQTDSVIDREYFASSMPSRIEYDDTRTLHEIVESLHETGQKPEVK